MPAQNTPYLVGNTYKRDHIFGVTISRADWAAGTGSDDFPNDFFPTTFTRKQLMAYAWRVRKWHVVGSGMRYHSDDDGLPPTLVPWNFDTELIHSTSEERPLEEAPNKMYLIGDVSDLRDNAGDGWLPAWAVEGHLPFYFLGPRLRRDLGFGGLFLRDHPQAENLPAPFLFGTLDIISFFGNVRDIPLTIFDPVTKLFHPFLIFGAGGVTTRPIPGRSPGGNLNIVVEGMETKQVPFYDGGSLGEATGDVTMTAVTYW